MSAPFPSHLSAQEIADLRLAGLATSKAGVLKRANAEGWPWVERMGRGGGRLYAWMGLPEAARNDFIARRGDLIEANLRPVGRPKGTGFFASHPEVADAVLVILAEHKRSARVVMGLLATQFSKLPKLRALQYFIQKVEEENTLLLTATRDPDRFKSRYRPALGRADASVSYAHEVWEIDTTKADVMCTDGRKNVLGIIDRWSRRARFLVVDSESAQSVRRMLVTTIAAWGAMPGTLKVDNGSGFINASVGSALDILGIALDACLPGHPEDKPFVERLFGTFNRERASLLKGFIGHNVAQAQKLRAAARKQTGRAVVEAHIDSAELQRILDAWTDGEYHQRTHSTLRMSPMEKWHLSPTPARAAPSMDILKVALSAYVGTATVGKRGIRWKNGRYWAATLVPFMDRQVTLRRDEDDLGALYVFDDTGRFIDIAVNAERSGMTEQQFAMAGRRQFNAHMNAAKAELQRKKRNFSIDDARQAMLRDEAERAGKLAHFPMPSRAAPTIAMDSISNAPEPPRPDQARLDEVLRATEPRIPALEKTVADKVAEADAIIIAAERGQDVDPQALRRARIYATSSEYRVEKTVSAYFAPPAQSLLTRQSGAA